MPHYGTLDVAAALGDTPAVATTDAPSWELRDVECLQVNWEVEDEPALELTPPALHPSVPSYASFFGVRFATSPVGPFTLAQVRLVVRAGIRPRGLCLGAVADTAEAVEALRQHWGYPVQHGEVTFTSRRDQFRVSAAVDGTEVVEFGIGRPEVIGGADLVTFDNLHLVRLGPDAEPALLQVDPEYAIHEADRGRPMVRLPDPDALGMRGRLRPTRAITGLAFRADTDLVPPRFRIDPTKPAIEGTTRLTPAAAA